MADVGVTVVGAGVVGLAIAARLAPKCPDLVVLERNAKHGQETSSRNSEVIHAGMYYPTGSLKARLCVEGNRRMYEVCAAHDIPHRKTTKLIVAADAAEVPALETLLALGRANGVELSLVSAAKARELEPNISAAAALFAPSSGVVSAHGLMDYYLHAARHSGAILQSHAALVGIERSGGDYRLTIRSDDGASDSFTTERLVNAAGLEADTVSALAGIDVAAAGYRLHYCKGTYFSVTASKASLVTRLVYPVPGHVSLGVHALVDFAGRLKFGPDAEYLPDRHLDYRVDESRLPEFAAAVRRLVPAIRDEDLTPDMSGIRPKLQAKGEPFRDFVILEESARGLPGFFNLVGIDSPGLTSAPAIAEHVADLMNVG
jgi:L-2-hydroxyglutarate oxidase LhgO